MKTTRLQRRYITIGVVLASLATTAVAVAFVSEPAPPDWLASEVARIAKIHGDASPDSVGWGFTDAKTASAVTFGNPNPEVDEYIVVLTGDFSVPFAFSPTGAPVPTGGTLVVTFDARDHIPNDVGISSGPANTDGITMYSMKL